MPSLRWVCSGHQDGGLGRWARLLSAGPTTLEAPLQWPLSCAQKWIFKARALSRFPSIYLVFDLETRRVSSLKEEKGTLLRRKVFLLLFCLRQSLGSLQLIFTIKEWKTSDWSVLQQWTTSNPRILTCLLSFLHSWAKLWPIKWKDQDVGSQ